MVCRVCCFRVRGKSVCHVPEDFASVRTGSTTSSFFPVLKNGELGEA
jgi:hypothetical protein